MQFFLVPGFSMMALSAAVEPLRALNRREGRKVYDWWLVARTAGVVTASNGFDLTASFGIAEAPRAERTIVVASLGIEGYRDAQVLEWLRQRRRAEGGIGAISNGALLLARTGLLDGHRATIHWEMQRQLAEDFPEIEVVPDLYCQDRGILTAAGGTASMDLMLSMIAEHHGTEAAADVADQFLHGAIRAPGVTQRPDLRWRFQVTDRRILMAIQLMEEHVDHPLKVSKIADFAGISERQLERLFEAKFGLGPSEFYKKIRLKAAHAMVLNSTHRLLEISDLCGFSSLAHFSQAFKAEYGVSPSVLRRGGRRAMAES
ncbi:GlxA family transcriptional regulator [Ostreiculturibacter nitratireducens]|uniref:GlxA family transcriptional regulator n=1 Tax=Ostreiculturibacter nitratireducens TaxID=3075226 RepID=UPI0031B5E63B